MLTAKQHKLLMYLKASYDKGVYPTYTDMMEAMGVKSKNSIHRLVTALEDRGFITRIPKAARSIQILKVPDKDMDQKGNVYSLHELRG